MDVKCVYVFSFWGLLLIYMMCLSCVRDDDFAVPDMTINQQSISGDTVDIATVKSIFAQEAGYFGDLRGEEQYTFEDTDFYMPAYVVSSDESGNFYQELILQDKAEHPTSGIKIMLQKDPLYTKYEIGRKVYVALDGFTIGFSNGVFALGVPEAGNNFIDNAPKSFEDKIIRTKKRDSIIPLQVEISELMEDEYAFGNLFVVLTDVQFTEEVIQNQSKQTFAADAEDFYDALRPLEECSGSGLLSLMTSTFADFKTLKLPDKKGNILGIATKTYDGSDWAIKLNSPSAIHFDKDRCGVTEDPEEPKDPQDPELPIDGQLAFPGGDFENWNGFKDGLNSAGLQDYASEQSQSGLDNSTALLIKTDEKTTSANDYVFITTPAEDLDSTYRKLSFYMRGTADKSISINLYKTNGDYYRFNLKDISRNATIQAAGSNQYTGKIDTDGQWVLITLDLAQISDVNISDSSSEFFALKIGKNADYNLYFDQFTIE